MLMPSLMIIGTASPCLSIWRQLYVSGDVFGSVFALFFWDGNGLQTQWRERTRQRANALQGGGKLAPLCGGECALEVAASL